jgi:hypothetical protein
MVPYPFWRFPVLEFSSYTISIGPSLQEQEGVCLESVQGFRSHKVFHINPASRFHGKASAARVRLTTGFYFTGVRKSWFTVQFTTT